MLAGELTVKDVTRQVELEVEFVAVGRQPLRPGHPRVLRERRDRPREFGLTWNIALEAGGVPVSRKIKIEGGVIRQA